jgi:transposase-like protein
VLVYRIGYPTNCGRVNISTTSSSKIIARIKRLVKLGMGYFSFETALRTLQGYEAMNMLRKDQINNVDKRDSMEQMAFIASLFGVAV